MSATVTKAEGTPPVAGRRQAGASTPDSWRDLLRGRWPWMVLAMAITLVIIWYTNRGSWSGGFFYDEQWRADFVRSERPWERMLLHDTPNPLGWVYVMKWITYPFGYNPALYRVISAGWYLLASGVLALLVQRVVERAPINIPVMRLTGGRISTGASTGLLSAVSVGLLAFSPEVSHYYHYFNNYTFEVLWVAIMLLALGELGRTRGAPVALAVLVGLSPLVLIGGLFALPAIGAAAFWWGWRADKHARWRRIGMLATGGAVGAAILGVTWITLYKTIGSKPSITSWWIDDGAALGGANTVTGLLRKAVSQLSVALAGYRVSEQGGTIWLGARAALVAAAVVGVVFVARRWAWMVIVPVSSYLLVVVASAAVHWPMTLERVNLAFTHVALLIVFLGMGRSVMLVARGTPLAMAAGFVAVAVALWPVTWAFAPDTFTRHAVNDLQPVAKSPSPRNVVLVYHRYLHWYAHDALINTSHPGKVFDLEWENEEDPDRLYIGLNAVLDTKALQPGDRVWCAMSYSNGMRNLEACNIDRPDLKMVSSQRLDHTEIRQFEVVTPPAP